MDDDKLCKWLRDNASGAYSPCDIAAHRIEHLKIGIEIAKANLLQLSHGRVHPQQEILSLEQILEVLEEYE